MNTITAVLRLIRFPYLIVVALIMYVTRFMIIKPLLELSEIQLQFSNLNFALLVFSLTTLVAAGYIINDYFDSKSDRETAYKGTVIDIPMPRFTAITLHTILNILGIVMIVWVSKNIGVLKLSILFILSTGVIWFYSTSYKHTAFLGKIILSVMISCLPLIITIYEIPDLNKAYNSILLEFRFLFNWTGGFAIFLFIVSFIRLIIKEKVEGIGECKSVFFNIKERFILLFMYFVLITYLILLHINVFYNDSISLWYFLIFLIIPASISILLIKVRKNVKVSNLKMAYFLIILISFAGIGFTIIIKYLFSNNLI